MLASRSPIVSRRVRSPFGEALTIASQIGAAIESAHDRGIIHRDLKPSNIKLSPDSGVKVLDFGLAKALLSVDSAAQMVEQPTMSSGGTGEGTILGTAAYMSPEQARGKDVDKRTDVWAFGCVLYDMLTGRPAFAGPTLTDTLANILTRDPDWVALPEGVPESISHLLRRCLQKDVRRRVKDIGDARIEIDECLARVSNATAASPPSRTDPQSPKRAAAPTTVLTAAIGSADGDRQPAAGLLDRTAGEAEQASPRPRCPLSESPVAVSGRSEVTHSELVEW